MFTTVLFPVDQSRETREAVETVANIVKTYNSRLVLLSIVEEPSAEQKNEQRRIMEVANAVAKLLQGAQTLFANKGIEASTAQSGRQACGHKPKSRQPVAKRRCNVATILGFVKAWLVACLSLASEFFLF